LPQLKAFGLADRATPPAIHTFKPRDITGGVTTLVESQGGIPLGDRRITMSQTRSTNGRVRVTVKLALPVLEDMTVNGVVRKTVTRTNYVDCVFNFDATSTTRERDDTAGFLWNLLHPELPEGRDYIVGLEGNF